MQKQGLQLFSMLVVLTIVTLVNYNFFPALSITGVTLLNLLVVVTAAYCCDFVVAMIVAFLAFLTINYFFTEPRYTFEVAHAESWASLICFLIVSVVVTSLVKQLKFQTLQSKIASDRAHFARTLAENLAIASEINQLLLGVCHLLNTEFSKSIGIVQFEENDEKNTEDNGAYQITFSAGNIEIPDHRLLNWVSENGKPISPYTDYWTDTITKSKHWLLPFNRLPSKDPILIVGDIANDESIETYAAIKSCVDQISQAYQRLNNSEKARSAELLAQEEMIQNSLLASISHDMRTPLTSILGAATTLQQANLNPAQAMQLNALIASQARYLAATTENILSLIQLESSAVKGIAMDWQSPEEIIGAVAALYQDQGEPTPLKISSSKKVLLIKGNANLLMQALVNLIENAKQAHIGNEPILIEVVKANERIHISINDRGPGFDESFSTTQIKKFSSSTSKGFGLGLSIVQAVAKLHNAIFTIHHREGGGVCATLSFAAAGMDPPNAG